MADLNLLTADPLAAAGLAAADRVPLADVGESAPACTTLDALAAFVLSGTGAGGGLSAARLPATTLPAARGLAEPPLPPLTAAATAADIVAYLAALGLVGPARPTFTAGAYTGLVADFDPATGSYSDSGTTPATDGGAVQQLNDPVSGRHVRQTTAGNKPTYRATGGPGGLPCVECDGGDFLTSVAGTLTEWKSLHDGTDWAVHALVRTSYGHADQYSVLCGTNGTSTSQTGFAVFFDDRSSVPRSRALVTHVTKGSSVVNDAQGEFFDCHQLRWWVLSVRHAAADGSSRFKVFRDGELVGSFDRAAPHGTGDQSYPFQLFADGTGAGGFRGSLARLLVYAGAGAGHDEATVKRLALDLRAAYGLADQPGFGRSVVARAYSTGGVGAYQAFPAVARLADDTLLAVWHDSATHEGDGRVVKATSGDGGATWSAAAEVLARSNVRETPSDSLAVLASGRLVLTLAVTADPGGTPALRTDVIYSDDGGDAWSSPYTVPTPAGYDNCFAYGRPIELTPGGRILAPAYGQRSGGSWVSILLKSDDGGGTWGFHAEITRGPSGGYADESSVVLTPSGRLLAATRNSTETVFEMRHSDDGGLTWVRDADLGAGDGCLQPAFCYLPDGRLALFCGDRTGTPGVGTHLSRDDGRTWGPRRMVHVMHPANGDVGHPAPVVTAAGRLGCLFYAGRGAAAGSVDLRWVSFPPAALG